MTSPTVIVVPSDIERHDIPEYGHVLWKELPYDARLALASFLFSKIVGNNGTFRKLIYDNLGFDPDAYQELYLSGGMRITNAMNNEEPIDFPDVVGPGEGV